MIIMTRKQKTLQTCKATDTVAQQQRVLGEITNIHGPLTSHTTTSLSPEPEVRSVDWSMMLVLGLIHVRAAH